MIGSTDNVPSASGYGIFTELPDSQRLSLCKCPTQWDTDGEGYAAVYHRADHALEAFNTYRAKYPEAYYAVMEVTLMLDTDMIEADPLVRVAVDLTTEAIGGDLSAAGELVKVLAGTS